MLVHLLAAVPLDGNVGHPLVLRLFLVLTHPRPPPPLLPALSPQNGLPGVQLRPTGAMHSHAGGAARTSASATTTTTAPLCVYGVAGFEEESSSTRFSGIRGNGDVGELEVAIRSGRYGVIDDEVQELVRRESV